MRSKTFKAGKAIFAGAVASLAVSLSVVDVMAVPMTVTAVVPDVCIMDTTSTLNFGTINPGTLTDTDATSTIDWRCTVGTVANISIDDGGGGSVFTRVMDDGGINTIAYDLYTPNGGGYNDIWGDLSGGTIWTGDMGAGMGIPNQQTTIVYGRVPGGTVGTGQVPGTYTDIVDVTILP